MEIRLAAPLQRDSIVDGEGIRAVIWTQGCIHNCFGCHNPETHDFNGGFVIDIDEIKKEILPCIHRTADHDRHCSCILFCIFRARSD